MGSFVTTTAANVRSLVVYLTDPQKTLLADQPAETIAKASEALMNVVAVSDAHGSKRVGISFGDAAIDQPERQLIETVLQQMIARFAEIERGDAPINPIDAEVILLYMAPADGSVRLGGTHINDSLVDSIIEHLTQLQAQNRHNQHVTDMFKNQFKKDELLTVIGNLQSAWRGMHYVLSHSY